MADSVLIQFLLITCAKFCLRFYRNAWSVV